MQQTRRFQMDVQRIGMRSLGTLPRSQPMSQFAPMRAPLTIGISAGASITPSMVAASQDERSTPIDPGPMNPYYGPGGPDPVTVAPMGPVASSLPTWVVPVLAAMGGAALGAVTIRALVG